MGKLIYLDNAATTKTSPTVVEAMLPYFTEYYGNASSIYSIGTKSKEAINKSRETIAATLGAKPEEIYFTAGGSESDNWALKATAEAYESKGKHIITTKIEHHAILHTCEYLEKRGYEISYIDVDENGKVKMKNVLGKTQAEVKEKLKIKLEESKVLDVAKSESYTVAEWAALWFEVYAKPNIRERTADYYNRYITKHIVPCLGDIKLSKLTGKQIQKMYNDLLDHGRERVSQKEKILDSPVHMFTAFM